MKRWVVGELFCPQNLKTGNYAGVSVCTCVYQHSLLVIFSFEACDLEQVFSLILLNWMCLGSVGITL